MIDVNPRVFAIWERNIPLPYTGWEVKTVSEIAVLTLFKEHNNICFSIVS